jgi:hypothetical protein
MALDFDFWCSEEVHDESKVGEDELFDGLLKLGCEFASILYFYPGTLGKRAWRPGPGTLPGTLGITNNTVD